MPQLVSAALPLVLAAILGGILGFEREVEHKAAGIRTYALVALGSCLFTVISRLAFGGGSFDPSRIASQIVVGVGFLGAGVIFLREGHVEGLTTAAGLWVTAAIGMAAGVGLYAIAVATTVVVLILLSVVKLQVEDRFLKKPDGNANNDRMDIHS